MTTILSGLAELDSLVSDSKPHPFDREFADSQAANGAEGSALSVSIRSGIPYFFISSSQILSTSEWLKLFCLGNEERTG